ncbi:integrase core domain-containing protein [Pseudomonas sp. ERMR1:02]
MPSELAQAEQMVREVILIYNQERPHLALNRHRGRPS